MFVSFLKETGASEKTRKNYRSDARYFLNWLIFTVESQLGMIPRSHVTLVRLVTPELIEQYKRFLLANSIPASTINRRLSTIRTLFSFCQNMEWVTTNPARVSHIPIRKTRSDDPHDLLDAFRRDLAEQGASKATVKNYMSDVRQFLDWIARQKP